MRTRRKKGRPVTYWHGGVPGLREGEHLVPRSVSGTHSYADLEEDYVGEANRVHFTIDRRYACFHANAYWLPGARGPGGGTVYVVEPIGQVEQDPDDRPGLSFMAPRARILRVARTGVVLSPLESNQAQVGHAAYVDGGEVYTEHGWQLAASDRCHLPEVQAALIKQNLALLYAENSWRRAHGRPLLERPHWLVEKGHDDPVG